MVKFYNIMKSMHKLLILFSTLIFWLSPVYAYKMVLPKEKKSIVNTNYALFIGQATGGESIRINDEHVPLASNGAFAHSVKLHKGENRIVVKSDYSVNIYKIYKNEPSQPYKPELIEFEPKFVSVIKDNTPFRSSPVDFGMNRMSHLFKDTNLIIDGEKGSFYRVFLSKNKYGWIAKDAVTDKDNATEAPKFITMNSETFRNASINTIEFTEKLPYTIDETDKEIIFKVYNPQASDNSVYTLNIRKFPKYVYKTFSANGVYVFKINSLPVPDNPNLEGITVVVDAGHGGSEFGAIGCLGDKEKDINLKIALELKDILEQMGACVVMTRECDGNVELKDRIKTAEDNCANIFVSIHLDSIPDIPMELHKNRGTTVYYYNQNSKELARSVSDSVTEAIKTKKNGIKTASFAVIRPSNYVGILVETAFMTNPADSVLYRAEDFARNSAMGIANGILKYINSK